MKSGWAIFLHALLLFIALFGETQFFAEADAFKILHFEFGEIIANKATQWALYLSLWAYFIVFVWIRSNHLSSERKRLDSLITLVLLVAGVRYACNEFFSINALKLLAGIVVGLGVSAWVLIKKSILHKKRLLLFIGALYLTFLTIGAINNYEAEHSFQYLKRFRWTGPWDNPNIFGLLMGTGVVLAAGFGAACLCTPPCVNLFRCNVGTCGTATMRYDLGRVWKKKCVLTCAVLLGFALILMTRGLILSFSRGAWLATGCGLIYLIVTLASKICGVDKLGKMKLSWARSVRFYALLLFSAAILILFFVSQANWDPVRRAFSITNSADFSWRNRLAAWKGGLQIVSENPWIGVGWGQWQELYEHYYLPPNLNEGGAIETNSHLAIGLILGVPATFCLEMYIWLCMYGEKSSQKRNRAMTLLDRYQIAFKAGAIVLAIGFWFDGGIFKLCTATTFWTLLELGSLEMEYAEDKS